MTTPAPALLPHHRVSLAGYLVDSWLSLCGLGRLRHVPSKTLGSQEQGCSGPFLSLGLLSKDFWLDGERLRLVGSERRRPSVFSDFWLGSKIQTSAIPTLDALIHWDKSLVEKKKKKKIGHNSCCFCFLL